MIFGGLCASKIMDFKNWDEFIEYLVKEVANKEKTELQPKQVKQKEITIPTSLLEETVELLEKLKNYLPR